MFSVQQIELTNMVKHIIDIKWELRERQRHIYWSMTFKISFNSELAMQVSMCSRTLDHKLIGCRDDEGQTNNCEVWDKVP